MPRIGAICAICLVLHLLTPVQANSSPAGPVQTPFRPGTVLVGARPGESLAGEARWLADHGLQVKSDLTPLPVVSVNVPTGQEIATVESLRRTGQVAFAELDYRAHATDVITPNDPGWSNQWGPVRIQAPAAWNIVTGTQVTIAVVDSGLQLSHEDLVSQVWTNPGEIPGNGLDDDGNGKIDDIHGWHIYHYWNGSTFDPAEDADIRDDYGHGTHVSGIAAARTNNGAGIAGIAWGARIMPVKVLDQYGNGWYSDIAAGILYATDNGAHIVNLSLGGASSSETLCAAVEYAYSKGAVLVAAAGNTGGTVFYPAACTHVLAVAATDSNDQRASFSNYGPQVDLAAPGVDIFSTWCHPDTTSGLCLGNYYFSRSGTSMAAPHVSGVAALIRSLGPELSASQVVSRLLETSDDVSSPGPDIFTGWGRINAYRAIADLEPLPDLWASLTGPQLIRIGEPFSYALTYGNRGVRNADSVTLTLQLASGLVSSQPPQQEIGTVLASTGPYTQSWQAMLQCSTVCLGAVYTTTVMIQSAIPERTSIDNTFTWIALAAWPVFLPLVLR